MSAIDRLKKILTFNGLSLILGIVGAMFGFLQMLIADFGIMISIRWFLLVLYISIFVILILIKLFFDVQNDLETLNNANHSNAIKFVAASGVLLIEKSKIFEFYSMVTLFYIDNNVEIVAAFGYVENIQEKFVQVKISEFTDDFLDTHPDIRERLFSNDATVLENLKVKNYYKFS